MSKEKTYTVLWGMCTATFYVVKAEDEDGSSITVGDCLEDLTSDIDELYLHFNCEEEEND